MRTEQSIPSHDITPPHPSWRAFLRGFAKIGLLSFGGPAAQMAVMHRVLVEETKWMRDADYLEALSFCMMLPGPEAMQLTTYCGWKLKGTWGGILAGALFVLPGALVMWGLALLYISHGQTPTMTALFLGMKAAIVVLVLRALATLARKTLLQTTAWGTAIAAFVAIAILNLPFPLVIVTAGLFGAFGMQSSQATAPRVAAKPQKHHSHLPRVLLTWGGLWVTPLAVLWATGQDKLLAIALFFSKLAVVTFGGAYAVLAYMSQNVVDRHGWLTPAEMMDGLGLAETTPGPLILVTEFVGALAGSTAAHPMLGASVAAALTLWVTFIPCYLWIFAGGPYIDLIATKPRLAMALKSIMAAVVGVIASLALWFARHLFFPAPETLPDAQWTLPLPPLGILDLRVALLTLLAGLLLTRTRLGVLGTLGLTVGAGVALTQHILPNL